MDFSNPLNIKVNLLSLSEHGEYNLLERVLYCGHNSGFFSCCSVILWNMHELQKNHHTLPNRLDFSRGFQPYRTVAQHDMHQDMYSLFFQMTDTSPNSILPKLPRIDQHGIYRLLPYWRINPFIQQYFKPSDQALAVRDQLVKRYKIESSKTLAIVYRGTDKNTEVTLAKSDSYVLLARKLLTANPEHRLWIQTDELSVREQFCHSFGDRCFFLNEMPVSSNGIVIHQQNDDILLMDRSDFGVLLVAVNSLLAQCDMVINHTGNMALWICLFRGHGRKVWQFDERGMKINPNGLSLLIGFARHIRIKLTRMLRHARVLGKANRS